MNESVWEHLKLLFFPMTLSSIIGYFIIKDLPKNYFSLRAVGIIISMLLTITIFFTYTGILGYNIAIFDILLFFITLFIGECISTNLIIYKSSKKNFRYFFIITLILFIIFTFNPPHINLFKDPITNTYGII